MGTGEGVGVGVDGTGVGVGVGVGGTGVAVGGTGVYVGSDVGVAVGPQAVKSKANARAPRGTMRDTIPRVAIPPMSRSLHMGQAEHCDGLSLLPPRFECKRLCDTLDRPLGIFQKRLLS